MGNPEYLVKLAQLVRFKVAEQSFGSVSICYLPNHGKRKVAAHKLKLGK